MTSSLVRWLNGYCTAGQVDGTDTESHTQVAEESEPEFPGLYSSKPARDV